MHAHITRTHAHLSSLLHPPTRCRCQMTADALGLEQCEGISSPPLADVIRSSLLLPIFYLYTPITHTATTTSCRAVGKTREVGPDVKCSLVPAATRTVRFRVRYFVSSVTYIFLDVTPVHEAGIRGFLSRRYPFIYLCSSSHKKNHHSFGVSTFIIKQ